MKNFFFQLVIALVFVGIAMGGYAFWYFETKQMSVRASELAGEIATKEAARSRTNSARAGLPELGADETFVASHFVATADIVSFLERLEATGKAFGAVVEVASVTGDDKSSEGSISLSLSVTGSFDAVMRTVGAIEHGPFANQVQSLTLDTSGDGWTASGIFVVGTSKPMP